MLGTSQKRLFAALCSCSSSKACIILALLSAFFSAPAADRRAIRNPPPKPETAPASIEALAERIKQSVVVISHFDRDGKEDGVGAGFVVSSNGLIATSLHVIGEGRPIKIQFSDGKSFAPAEIHAWDRKLDLAVVHIAATNLPALALADSDSLKQGTAVLAMGNPLGLKHSIVQGVVSARRDFEGVEMIQLAIPIEPGNSGGPLLDMQGRVNGLLTMKSAMSANLGFATPANELKPLLKRPNPMPMARWARLGALNTNDWTVLFGSHWTQKSGRIQTESPGSGFGGRSLCLWEHPVPPRPYEVAVTVRLEDESGAAGLVFGSDGAQKHYGFYPSAGQLRLTRFEGPSVFSWTILQQVPSIHYRRGDWNTLKVRREAHSIRCFVNDHLVIESEDDALPDGKVGLAKFRDTRASFRNFQVSSSILAATTNLSVETAPLLKSALENVSSVPIERLASLPESETAAAQKVFSERAAQLEQQASELRQLATALRTQTVQKELLEALRGPEDKIDLFHSALLIAKLDNPELDMDAYQRQLEAMAKEIQSKLSKTSDAQSRLNALQEYLFLENGFHGSRTDYYNRANSYLNEVIDEREGLPITLSVLFIELGHRLGLKELAGVALPGHFMVKYSPEKGEEQLIDVFDEGKTVTREEADQIAQEYSGLPLSEAQLKPAKKREIIVRMLRNLHSAAQRAETGPQALRYLDVIIALLPESAMDRLDRGRLRLQNGDRPGARQDFKWLLDNDPPGIDMERVAEVFQSL